MKHLEEQLKASRHTERPGLSPPPGGWEEIARKLAEQETTAGDGTPAPRFSPGYLGAWLVVVPVFFAAFWLAGGGEKLPELSGKAFPVFPTEQTQPTGNDTGAEKPVAEATTHRREMDTVSLAAIQGSSASTVSRASSGRGHPPVKHPPPARTRAEPENAGRTVEQQRPPTLRSRTVGSNSRAEPAAEAHMANPSEPSARPTREADVKSMTLPQTAFPPVSVGPDRGGSSAGRAIAKLLPPPISGIPAVKPVTVGNDLGRSVSPGKPRSRAVWQVHGSANAGLFAPTRTPWELAKFVRTDSPDPSHRFILPSGEVIAADYLEDAADNFTVRNALLRVGIGRQADWGGLYRASIGAYWGRASSRNASVRLTHDQLITSYDAREFVVPLELGFHFTFNKRRRLRPFLGINAIAFLYYKGEESNTFFDEQTGQTGLISGMTSTEYYPLYPNLSFTAGLQYQLNDRWSVGVNVWGNAGDNILLEAPAGLEIRRSFR